VKSPEGRDIDLKLSISLDLSFLNRIKCLRIVKHEPRNLLDGDETKRLKDVNVVVADVCPGEGVGHVALMEMGKIEIGPGMLKKDRLFR
jgi:hypothetical protein